MVHRVDLFVDESRHLLSSSRSLLRVSRARTSSSTPATAKKMTKCSALATVPRTGWPSESRLKQAAVGCSSRLRQVAAAGAAFFWIVRVQSTISGGAEQHIDTTITNIASRAEITGMSYSLEVGENITGGNLTFVLRNLGSVPFAPVAADTRMTLKSTGGNIICTNNWADATMLCNTGCSSTDLDPSDTIDISLNLTSDCDLDINSTGYADQTVQYEVDFPGAAPAGGSFIV